MRLRITKSFRDKLNEQIKYIAQDKPDTARKFKTRILQGINNISKMPYMNRKSIFFERDDIRDLIIKGYIIVYKINKKEKSIEVFGFTKFQDNL